MMMTTMLLMPKILLFVLLVGEVVSIPVQPQSGQILDRFRGRDLSARNNRPLPTKRRTTFESRKPRSSSLTMTQSEDAGDPGKSISSTVPLTLGLITEKSTRQNLKIPKQNLVKNRKDKLPPRQRSRLHLRRPRKVTKELREFWTKLDQRKKAEGNAAAAKEVGEDLGGGDASAKAVSGSPEPELYEDYPFLSESYDYSNYYYDFPPEEASVPKNASAVQETITSTVSLTNTSELTSSTMAPSETTETAPNIEAALKKAVEKSSVTSPTKLLGRKAPTLVQESTSVHASTVPLPTNPMTARDSFIIKRQSLSRRQQDRPRDILKEFPIFRHLNRNVPERKMKKLSLHERLQNRFSTEQPLNGDLVVPETEQPIINFEIEVPDTSLNETVEVVAEIDTFVTEPATFAEEVTEPIPSTTIAYSNTNTTVEVQREVTFSTSETHKVVKSSSHSPTAPPTLESQLGLAPLGETPFGLAPFGFTPLGEAPFGVSPGGVSPLGNSSDASNTSSLVPSENIPANDTNGRYHVQVVSPDGSINGDYVVVDPVTGDLNGVRYEAAQDVDPQLVQRALLNFLSLDPRLKPDVTTSDTALDSPATEEEIPETTILPYEIMQDESESVQFSSTLSTSVPETTLLPDVDKTLL